MHPPISPDASHIFARPLAARFDLSGQLCQEAKDCATSTWRDCCTIILIRAPIFILSLPRSAENALGSTV